MNKHNVIGLFDYKRNKIKVNQERQCFEFLDILQDKIKLSKTYVNNLDKYLDVIVKDGNIEKSFAINIKMQVDFIMKEAYKEFLQHRSKQ